MEYPVIKSTINFFDDSKPLHDGRLVTTFEVTNRDLDGVLTAVTILHPEITRIEITVRRVSGEWSGG